MKGTLALLAKFGVTLAIFVGIFLEFGGGYRAVRTARLGEPGAFAAANPAFPSLLGRLRGRLRGTSLPPPRLAVSIEKVCLAAVEGAVFVELEDGSVRRFKPLRHCSEGGLTTVYARTPGGSFVQVPLAEAPPEAYFRIQGFQLVPAEMSELWAVIRSLSWRVFLAWFLAAMAVKLVGVFANVWRWRFTLIMFLSSSVDYWAAKWIMAMPAGRMRWALPSQMAFEQIELTLAAHQEGEGRSDDG